MFSVNIKLLRKQHGYTSQYVAENLCINPSTYRSYEAMHFCPENVLVKIADFYNVPLDMLLRTNDLTGRQYDGRDVLAKMVGKKISLKFEKPEDGKYSVTVSDSTSKETIQVSSIGDLVVKLGKGLKERTASMNVSARKKKRLPRKPAVNKKGE